MFNNHTSDPRTAKARDDERCGAGASEGRVGCLGSRSGGGRAWALARCIRRCGRVSPLSKRFAFIRDTGIAGPLTFASGDNPEAYGVTDVTARVRHSADVCVPHVGDLVSTEEDDEDHRERLEALFEWVGMACLGAQRQVHTPPRSLPDMDEKKQAARQRSRRPVCRRVRSALASLDRRRHASEMARLDGRRLCPIRDRHRRVRSPLSLFFPPSFDAWTPRGWLMSVADRSCRRHILAEITLLSRSRCTLILRRPCRTW